MENDKQWITYVFIADTGAGYLEVGRQNCPKAEKGGYKIFRVINFLGENRFTNLLLLIPGPYITSYQDKVRKLSIGVENFFSFYP